LYNLLIIVVINFEVTWPIYTTMIRQL